MPPADPVVAPAFSVRRSDVDAVQHRRTSTMNVKAPKITACGVSVDEPSDDERAVSEDGACRDGSFAAATASARQTNRPCQAKRTDMRKRTPAVFVSAANDETRARRRGRRRNPPWRDARAEVRTARPVRGRREIREPLTLFLSETRDDFPRSLRPRSVGGCIAFVIAFVVFA